MVYETRRIVLEKEELFLALEAHGRMTPHFLPRGRVVDFEALSPTSIMVTVETEPDAQEATVIFTDGKLVQALVRFCLENNIMLPRAARKSVAVDAEHVSLCMDMDVDIFMPRSAPASFADLCMAAG
ncbi:MAG: hypothetical protein KGI37_01255 [Alphaproteobacteria bacterium]|nr:hypothetical protein [Alphaproteobacteria bacterium]